MSAPTGTPLNLRAVGVIAIAVVAALLSIYALGVSLATRNGVGVTAPAAAGADTAGEDDAPGGTVTASLTEFAIEMPDTVAAGATVAVVNDGEVPHNLRVEDADVGSADLDGGETDEFTLDGLDPGTYTVLCDIPGHATAGMTTELAITGEGDAAGDAARAEEPEANETATAEPAAATTADRVAADAAATGASVGAREPQTVALDLTTTEREGQMADGSTYTYWTFDDQVPGPMLRVREGDTVELSLTNSEDSVNVHSIDLHAVNGPGGAAEALQVAPGETRSVSFTALNPGVYVYHCATPHVPTHIANGMYGLIVVEPEGGLERVDREFYVMQGELYTQEGRGAAGQHTYDGEALTAEDPTYVVFNGQAGALTGDHALQAEVGETVRLFVGNGGPNLSSSFHVIGEIFDRARVEGGSLVNENVQTTAVPPGGATWVEFTVDVPGDYLLVDHAISRAIDKGAAGVLHVTGPEDPAVFDAGSEG